MLLTWFAVAAQAATAATFFRPLSSRALRQNIIRDTNSLGQQLVKETREAAGEDDAATVQAFSVGGVGGEVPDLRSDQAYRAMRDPEFRWYCVCDLLDSKKYLT